MRIYLRLLVAFLLLSAGNIVYAEAQQEKRVTGTVTSEGEPLPGVSVQVKGPPPAPLPISMETIQLKPLPMGRSFSAL